MRPGPIEIVACPRCGALAKQRTIGSGSTMGARAWSDGKLDMPMLPRPPALVCCAACKSVHRPQDRVLVGSFPFYQELDAVVWDLEILDFPAGAKPLLRKLYKRFGVATEHELRTLLPLTVATGLKHLAAGAQAEKLEKLGARTTSTMSARPDYTGPLLLTWIAAPDLAPPTETQALETLASPEPHDHPLTLRQIAWQAANDPRRGRDPASPVEWSPAARHNLEALLLLLPTSDPEARLITAEVLRELGRFDEALTQLGDQTGPLATRLREHIERRHPGVFTLESSEF